MEDGSFLDAMYKYIASKNNVNHKDVMEIEKYLKDNDYDTEGVELDVKEYQTKQSNLANNITNKESILLINKFIKHCKCMYHQYFYFIILFIIYYLLFSIRNILFHGICI